MIDIKELRVGNWVQKSGSDKQCIVTLERFWEHYNTADAFYYIEPIKLNPLILERCGFECKLPDTYTKGDISLHFDGTGYYNINSSFLINIDNLHNLQNWWFFNTGEELNYQP